MDPVRLGVIGCGVIGNHHLQIATASPRVEVVAAADLIDDRAQAAGEKYGVAALYKEGLDLLDHANVEAVVLALPAYGRTELALRAFAGGKHVLNEKPIAMNAGEVKQMIAARGDLVAACCSSRFGFSDAADAVAELIVSGALGELRVLHCRALIQAGPRPDAPRPEWRLKKALNAGGILCNWGCYDLDYLLGLTGWKLKPKTVFANVWPIAAQLEPHVPPDSEAETHFAALIRCECGTVISFERAEYAAAATEGAWHIVGSRGSVKLNMNSTQSEAIAYHEATTESGLVTTTLYEGEGKRQANGPMEDFVAAIREKRPLKTGLEQALVVQQITDAIYASAEQGTAVEIGAVDP